MSYGGTQRWSFESAHLQSCWQAHGPHLKIFQSLEWAESICALQVFLTKSMKNRKQCLVLLLTETRFPGPLFLHFHVNFVNVVFYHKTLLKCVLWSKCSTVWFPAFSCLVWSWLLPNCKTSWKEWLALEVEVSRGRGGVKWSAPGTNAGCVNRTPFKVGGCQDREKLIVSTSYTFTRGCVAYGFECYPRRN